MNDITTNGHDERVEAIAAQVRSYFERGKSFRIYHGSTNTTRVVRFDPEAMVDASNLSHVLSVDIEAEVAVVEANVPMDQLVKAALVHNLVPPVVMEFPGITVGGGLQGGAGESSSFRWGCFNRILNWYEMILADGSLVRVSPEENADLYWGAAGSYGSLGVVTRAEVKLIPATKYVEVSYLPSGNFTEVIKAISQAASGEYDFIDGIVYSPDLSVMITGKLTDNVTGKIRQFGRARDEWFYLHARKLAETGSKQVEKVPLYDYLFRYDRGAFWMGAVAFDRLKTPFNRLSRWALNPLLNTRKMYQALQASAISQECIIQDLAIPTGSTVEFIEYINRHFDIYPLWLCPLAVEDKSFLQANYLKTQAIVNVGVWGKYDGREGDIVKANRQLEAKVTELGGRKWLYAETAYNEDEFWNIYDRNIYYQLRRKYQAESLPSVYDKVHTKGQHKVSVKRGVWKALTNQDVLRRDKASSKQK